MASEVLTVEAVSHVYRCGSPGCSLATSSALMGEQGEFCFIFFQITGTGWHTPPAVSVPEAINHLKMDMVESFPPYEAEDYKNKGQMESGRGIEGGGGIVFHSVTEVSGSKSNLQPEPPQQKPLLSASTRWLKAMCLHCFLNFYTFQ